MVGRSAALACLALGVLAGCADEPPVLPTAPNLSTAAGEPTRWVVVFNQPNALPRRAEAAVAAAGGTVLVTLPQIGALAALSSDPNFGVKMAADSSVKSVGIDVEVQMIPDTDELTAMAMGGPDGPGPTEPAGVDVGGQVAVGRIISTAHSTGSRPDPPPGLARGGGTFFRWSPRGRYHLQFVAARDCVFRPN